ncbi:zinc finger protein ZFPM1 [Rhynchocyon petersi]
MSRRKQSNPRQIKRSLSEMDAREEVQAIDTGLTESETAPVPEPSGDPEPLSPAEEGQYGPSDGVLSPTIAMTLSSCPQAHSPTEVGGQGLPKGIGSWLVDSDPKAKHTRSPPPPPPKLPPTPPKVPEESGGQEPDTRSEKEVGSAWSGPDELELVLQEDGQQCLRARHRLAEGVAWGPFRGSIQRGPSSPEQEHPHLPRTLQLDDEACWLRMLPQATTEAEANLLVHRKEEALWCRTTKPVPAGGLLRVRLEAEPHRTPSPPRKREPGAAEGQPPAHTDIQLLPQQAGMASILATAIVNKDIFPCKDCGIWYRSERNLQAHLLYYCASRQNSGSPAEEKPKETYPNERVCPFPQCRKSCPSASSLEIHMRSHSGERPFMCLICLSAFTTKANCERHLKVHTDTLSGVCHSCGFVSTTRDILYSHLVTSHMICQPGSKGELFAQAAGYPVAKPAADSLAGFPQQAALHGTLAAADVAPSPLPSLERKPPAEATNGEPPAAPQNGSEAPPSHRSIKVEAEEAAEAAQAPSPAPGAPSRTPSPRSPPAVRIKTERCSPSPACSPAPAEPGALPGPLFLPQLVFGADALPQASEILAKMSELVHSRLKQGQGAPGLFAGVPAPKGATCFECEITFNNINNYYVHKRLYCSGRHLGEDAPGARRLKALPPAPAPSGLLQSPPPPPAPEGDASRSPPSPEAREEEPSAATPEAEAAGRGSEGSQSPGSSVDDAEDDPSRTLCEACNIRFSRHETYTVHKRYYCASRHDPPPRRPGPGAPPPARTRRRRKLYELHAPGAPPPAGHAHAPPAEPPAPPASPRPGTGSGRAPSPAAAAEGPIDLSKKPRRQGPEAPAGPPPLADYHECTACRVSFHSLEAYLAHKKFACPAAQLRGLRAPDDAAVVCPYCPASGPLRGDLVQHLRRAHGLLLGGPPAGPGAPEARTPPASPPRAARDSLNGQEPKEPAAGSPRPGPPASPAAPGRSLSPVPDPLPPAHVDKGAQTPGKGPPAPSGNHRYCRLCNIKFSSLSTFIAHKKYYCSSHAAEHVK